MTTDRKEKKAGYDWLQIWPWMHFHGHFQGVWFVSWLFIHGLLHNYIVQRSPQFQSTLKQVKDLWPCLTDVYKASVSELQNLVKIDFSDGDRNIAPKSQKKRLMKLNCKTLIGQFAWGQKRSSISWFLLKCRYWCFLPYIFNFFDKLLFNLNPYESLMLENKVCNQLCGPATS